MRQHLPVIERRVEGIEHGRATRSRRAAWPVRAAPGAATPAPVAAVAPQAAARRPQEALHVEAIVERTSASGSPGGTVQAPRAGEPARLGIDPHLDVGADGRRRRRAATARRGTPRASAREQGAEPAARRITAPWRPGTSRRTRAALIAALHLERQPGAGRLALHDGRDVDRVLRAHSGDLDDHVARAQARALGDRCRRVTSPMPHAILPRARA